MKEYICKEFTKKGIKCKNKTRNKEGYCHIHLITKINNNEKIIYNKIKKQILPNEVIFKIFDYLDLESKIIFSKTSKKLHNYFIRALYKLNIKEIMLLAKNKKTLHLEYEYILKLFMNCFKMKGFYIENFEYGLNSYEIKISNNDNYLEIFSYNLGVRLELNQNKIGYIKTHECTINNILDIVTIIYKYINRNGNIIINDIYNDIIKEVPNFKNINMFKF